MVKILFICHGNICRSPMAEYVMKQLVRDMGLQDRVEIASAATSREEIGNDIHPGTKRQLKKEGIPFERRAARQLTAAEYGQWDFLIVMDQSNLRNLRRIIGEDSEHKVSRLLEFCGENGDIADPWYTGDFDCTYRDVLRGCRALLPEVQARLKTDR